ncbi:chorismate--pyruvate lyase family protein [Microbulbifer litoralis]|uniref:chorismate--pyruvate lyase family protein n=1 Tax=Microbulbifer litoralis TaxID=2933965 RepID=UPI002541D9B0|nr:chorismate pyruvate-lyase family protein [Microbulbifer sp. GX H0434]
MIRLSNDSFRGVDGDSSGADFLSKFQRIILSSDGTMTNLLEEITGENLCANKIMEDADASINYTSGLRIERGQSACRRIVTLQGAESGINYLYAESVIALDNLDKRFSQALLSTGSPIGKVWELYKVETYKKLEEWGEVQAGEIACYFAISEEESLLYRTYFVFSGGKPVMKIKEMFPKKWFENINFSISKVEKNGWIGITII